MELPFQAIRKYAKEKSMIVPYEERRVYKGYTFGAGPSTYDFRCKQHVVLLPHRMYWRWRLYKFIDKLLVKCKLQPWFEDYHCGFALVSTLEKVAIPDNVSATPMDKSTWVRQGLSVFNTHFDPGFVGYPTIEITNNSTEIIRIPAGVAICQFKFSYLSEPTVLPYRGKYMHQPDKPVPAIEGKSEWS